MAIAALKSHPIRKIICCVLFVCIFWELLMLTEMQLGQPKTEWKDRLQQSNEYPIKGRKSRNAKIIYYLHIHKAGGTTMCGLAKKERHLSVEFKHNCNVQQDQHCCGQEDSIEAQIRYAETSPYDFVACEREMYDAMATDYYDYVVTLRDSVSRYVSHWSHVRGMAHLNRISKLKNNNTRAYEEIRTGSALKSQRSSRSRNQKVKNLGQSGPKRALSVRRNEPSSSLTTPRANSASGRISDRQKTSLQSQGQRLAPKQQPKQKIKMNDIHEKYVIVQEGRRYFVGNFSAWWQLQPDNYSTRMICGSKCLHSPKFQITPQLFEYTLQRLSMFSHVLFLEDMKASYTAFAKAVGWEPALNGTHLNKNKQLSDNKTTAKRLADNNVTYDPFMTALDDALYGFARKRFDGDYTKGKETASLVKEFVDSESVQDYFRDGSSRNCKDPCCGDCSKWR